MAQSSVIKILIADDHPIVRKTLSSYLAQEPGMQVVGEVGDGARLLEQARQLQPNLLLLDVNMPGPNVVEMVQLLKEQHADLRIVVLTASKRGEHVMTLLKAGVEAYVLKEDNPRQLLQAIAAAAAGEEWLSPRLATILAHSIRRRDELEQVDLTERELDVLRLMVTGINNAEIATRLFIATNTVKNHVRSIFRKLDVSTRVEAVVYALDHQLVDAHPDDGA